MIAEPIRMQNNSERNGDNGNRGTSVITRTKPKTKKPNLYRVLLLNDDYTPMDFVIHILERFAEKFSACGFGHENFLASYGAGHRASGALYPLCA